MPCEEEFMNERKQMVWELIRSEPGPDLRLFRVRFDVMRNPRNAHNSRVTVLESPDWVNVVALAPDGKVVVVRQYRFGMGQVTTELPSGIVEPGEASLAAAQRELQEETGYATDSWEYLGAVEANPAFLDNHCHHWLARKAIQVGLPTPDEGENLQVLEMRREELQREIAEGRMRHSLTFSALARVFDLRTLL